MLSACSRINTPDMRVYLCDDYRSLKRRTRFGTLYSVATVGQTASPLDTSYFFSCLLRCLAAAAPAHCGVDGVPILLPLIAP